MLQCPFCNKDFEEHAWGSHTLECPDNPKNKKVIEKYGVTEPEKVKKPKK
jgi:hypothetical protein